MTVECINCARFTLRGVDLARHGFGACDLPRTPIKAGHYVSPTFTRECNGHRPVEEEKAQARREWLGKRSK